MNVLTKKKENHSDRNRRIKKKYNEKDRIRNKIKKGNTIRNKVTTNNLNKSLKKCRRD